MEGWSFEDFVSGGGLYGKRVVNFWKDSVFLELTFYFMTLLKLNEKKALLKNMVWRGGLNENVCRRRGLMFSRRVGIVSKKGGLTRMEWKKM